MSAGGPPAADPHPVREREIRRWHDSGQAWDRWADSMADPAARLNQPLLAALALQPHHTLLDLASGAGEPAITAAKGMSPTEGAKGGRVLASDLVPAMLAGARRRGAGVAALSFLAADMTALPLAPASVDRISCRFGLMFVPDAAGAVAEMHRVLQPGGIAALLCWGPKADNTLFRLLDEALGGVPELAVLFRFAEEGALGRLLLDAGFDTVSETSLEQSALADAAKPFWRPTLDMAFTPALARMSAEGRAAAEVRIATAVALETEMDGKIPVHLHARLLVAHK
ncbi:ubiquinone/menaquinone biosynthesis C-methylase UbiE [Nitrospirillum amazonense]|uniref:Ubiquinone/menaquinone biosynthesis C-methylase UbiE n=1 Tax=Nitrospirillum amazonense TaxID=28077 RepID=A0A560F531_9PROT|nr:methyltransferase domain-containing protein [Nitrospirillum amazonense]TWB16723.1 ubiquinone/menaquinone biosynthesis C-methylase UbiE [Nitrospirillum amazonense]